VLRMRVNDNARSREIVQTGLRLFPNSERLRRLSAALQTADASQHAMPQA
jgi:hypothetical protein